MLDVLTSLRFFASAAIVYTHGQDNVFPAFPGAPHVFALGVSFFFILSGFVLSYAYETKFSIRNFYASRIAKLYPVHLITGLLWILLLLDTSVFQYTYGIRDMEYFLLLQAWIPVVGTVFYLNGASWCLSCEMFFYALFPLIKKKNYALPVCIISLLFTCIMLYYFDAKYPPVRPGMVFPPEGQFFTLHAALQFPLVRLPEFCCGILAFKIYQRVHIKSSTLLEILAVLLVFAFSYNAEAIRIFFDNVGYTHIGIWINQCGGMLFFAFAILIFSYQAGLISNLLKNKILVYLGNISYATYMIHVVIINFFTQYGQLLSAYSCCLHSCHLRVFSTAVHLC